MCIQPFNINTVSKAPVGNYLFLINCMFLFQKWSTLEILRIYAAGWFVRFKKLSSDFVLSSSNKTSHVEFCRWQWPLVTVCSLFPLLSEVQFLGTVLTQLEQMTTQNEAICISICMDYVWLKCSIHNIAQIAILTQWHSWPPCVLEF